MTDIADRTCGHRPGKTGACEACVKLVREVVSVLARRLLERGRRQGMRAHATSIIPMVDIATAYTVAANFLEPENLLAIENFGLL